MSAATAGDSVISTAVPRRNFRMIAPPRDDTGQYATKWREML
jgi:hypothetical protein